MSNVKLQIISGGGGETGCAGGDCPTFYKGDDGHLYIQGYVVPDEIKSGISLNGKEDLVRISAELVNVIKSSQV